MITSLEQQGIPYLSLVVCYRPAPLPPSQETQPAAAIEEQMVQPHFSHVKLDLTH